MTATSNVPDMQIEQALYGESRGGHSLLASSGDDAVSTAIVQRLDLPDTASPDAEWSPFLRGFPYQDRYVLSRTFHDTAASRGGMVFSHALLAPLDELVETPDPQPLLRLLATSNGQRPDATTVRLPCTDTPVPRAIDLIDAADALAATGTFPVVRLGHIGFDDLVVALWAHLPPEIRRGFAFRLSFGPPDLVEQPMPALVCTPDGTAGRWSEYPVIRTATPHEPASLAAAILSGHARATPLIEFMQQLEVRPATFPDLRLAEQAYQLDIGEPSLDRRVGVMRLIEKLSPDSDAGDAGKKLLAQRLCDALSGARVEEILRLRNLQLSAVPEPKRVWKAVAKWVAENSYAQDQDTEMLSVLEDATTSDAAVEEWRGAILNGLAAAARSAKSSFPRAFWRWIKIRPEIVTAVFPHVPAEAGVEERLARATPRTLDQATAASLEPLALSRGWLRLHGTVLSASASASDAARRQVAVDTDPSFLEGLRAALRRAKPAELVECVSAFAPSTMNSRGSLGSSPLARRLSIKAWTTTVFSVAPSTTARTCLSPLPSTPIAAIRTWSPTCRPSIWMTSRSSSERSEASQAFIFLRDSATKRRETADFEVPSPRAFARSPSGRRTARWYLRVDTFSSIRLSAHQALPFLPTGERFGAMRLTDRLAASGEAVVLPVPGRGETVVRFHGDGTLSAEGGVAGEVCPARGAGRGASWW